MPSSSGSKDFFTASQIAVLCQVDLKTIHNWAERGELPHFRTPGRHLRFQRAAVLDFLRKYGYPIPEGLAAERPRIALMLEQSTARDQATQVLSEHFEIGVYTDAVAGLVDLGRDPPDALVLGDRVGRIDGAKIIAALKSNPHTKYVRTVLFAQSDESRREALEAGASAYVKCSDVGGLRDTLQALLGLRH